jgi:hypothetical protein
VWTFLRGGSGSPKLDEEVTVEVSRTCWTTWQGVRPISSPLMHMEGSLSPSWSEATCVGRSYSDEPVGGPPSAQGRFGQRPLAQDPIYRGTASRCGEGVIHGVGRVAPPLFQLPLAGGRRSRRGMRPSPFCYPSDDSLFSLSLSSRAYVSSLEVCLTSRPTTSAGGLTSRGSPWPPPRPCARLRAQ